MLNLIPVGEVDVWVSEMFSTKGIRERTVLLQMIMEGSESVFSRLWLTSCSREHWTPFFSPHGRCLSSYSPFSLGEGLWQSGLQGLTRAETLLSQHLWVRWPFPFTPSLSFSSSQSCLHQIWRYMRQKENPRIHCWIVSRVSDFLSSLPSSVYPSSHLCLFYVHSLGFGWHSEKASETGASTPFTQKRDSVVCLCVLPLFWSFRLPKGFLLGPTKYSNYETQFKNDLISIWKYWKQVFYNRPAS